jgi:hypothetical protein
VNEARKACRGGLLSSFGKRVVPGPDGLILWGAQAEGSVSVARQGRFLFSLEGPGEEVPGSRNRRQGSPASGGGTPGEDRTTADDGDTQLLLHRTPTRG